MTGSLHRSVRSRDVADLRENLRRVDRERERIARQLDCPTCQARPSTACRWTIEAGHALHGRSRFIKVGDGMRVGHTGRYRAAYHAGLLPELAWLFDQPLPADETSRTP